MCCKSRVITNLRGKRRLYKFLWRRKAWGSRHVAATVANAASGGEAAKEPWFKVLRHLHLGLGLTVGCIYPKQRFLRRCPEDKKSALEALMLDDSVLLPVDAPAPRRSGTRAGEHGMTREERRVARAERDEKRIERREERHLRRQWRGRSKNQEVLEQGPLPPKAYRLRGGRLVAAIFFDCLSVSSKDCRSLAEVQQNALGLLRLRDRTGQLVGEGASFDNAVTAALADVQEVSGELTSTWTYQFAHSLRRNATRSYLSSEQQTACKQLAVAKCARTSQTHCLTNALDLWSTLRDKFGIGIFQALRESRWAKRQAADTRAREILERLPDGEHPSKQDVLEVLRLWSFKQNKARLNVIPEGQEFVYSDTLGIVRTRGSMANRITLGAGTAAFPNFIRLLCSALNSETVRGGDDVAERKMALMPFTSISLNKNYAARRHRDGSNVGPSMILTLGDFEGGRLRYWKEDTRRDDVTQLAEGDCEVLDPSRGLQFFDGRRAHEVEEFSGEERYSIVFFMLPRHELAAKEKLDVLTTAGFELPTPESLVDAMKRAGMQYDVQQNKRKREAKGDVLSVVSGDCVVVKPAKPRKRAQASYAACSPNDPRYLSLSLPNLGLGLRVGETYSEGLLRKKCRGDAQKLDRLHLCLEDNTIFSKVVPAVDELQTAPAAGDVAGEALPTLSIFDEVMPVADALQTAPAAGDAAREALPVPSIFDEVMPAVDKLQTAAPAGSVVREVLPAPSIFDEVMPAVDKLQFDPATGGVSREALPAPSIFDDED